MSDQKPPAAAKKSSNSRNAAEQLMEVRKLNRVGSSFPDFPSPDRINRSSNVSPNPHASPFQLQINRELNIQSRNVVNEADDNVKILTSFSQSNLSQLEESKNPPPVAKRSPEHREPTADYRFGTDGRPDLLRSPSIDHDPTHATFQDKSPESKRP